METTQRNEHGGEGICPVSGTKGKRVDTATVKCLLSVSLRAVLNCQYYFCPEANCPVVYFNSDGTQQFGVSDVRERVYQKEPDSNSVSVCYCFHYTIGDIREAVDSNDSDGVVDAITTGIRAGQCACDWRNPQGDCCLGNVNSLMKRFHGTE